MEKDFNQLYLSHRSCFTQNKCLTGQFSLLIFMSSPGCLEDGRTVEEAAYCLGQCGGFACWNLPPQADRGCVWPNSGGRLRIERDGPR